MWTLLKSLFRNECPDCGHTLQYEEHDLCQVKVCTTCDYREETYSHLGVRIVYNKDSDRSERHV